MTRHSSSNGKSPDEPTVAPSAEAPSDRVKVPIRKRIIFMHEVFEAEKMPDGELQMSVIVIEGGQPVEHIYVLDDDERKALLTKASGGLTIP